MKARNTRGDEPKWFYNLKTGEVEFGMLSAVTYRVGPFETEAQAKNALNLMRERSQKWSEEDAGEH